MRTSTVVSSLLLMLLPAALWADGAGRFGLPVLCAMGEQCVIQSYVDRDPGEGVADYQCGPLSYPNHQGTDIRVKSYKAMREGSVVVVAAAAGQVVGVRDGVEDGPASGEIDEQKQGKQAGGNGVLIDHGDGWRSQYSHMKKGSVLVAKGQQVRAGQPMGRIGQSGRAAFPHLDFAVSLKGRYLDPFTGLTDTPGCHAPRSPLWNAEALRSLSYIPTGELTSGFSPRVPDKAYVSDPPDLANTDWSQALALHFWVYIYGAHDGDKAKLQLLDPKGQVIGVKEVSYDQPKAPIIRQVGVHRANPSQPWPPGTYKGEYTLHRAGVATPVLSITRQIAIP